jgi:hypothetical protein
LTRVLGRRQHLTLGPTRTPARLPAGTATRAPTRTLVWVIGLGFLLAATMVAGGCRSSGGSTGSLAGWTPYSTERVELYPVTVGENMGYIDKSGSLVITARFATASAFSEGLAAVQSEATGLWGYIDKTGAPVIEPQFAEASAFSEGAAPVRPEPEGLWGYVDSTGALVLPTEFSFAWGFSEGWARVRTDKKAGYIDKTGRWVLVLEDYLAVDEFSDGVAPVYSYDADLYGFVNKAGKLVLKIRFQEAWGFTEGLAGVMLPPEGSQLGQYGYIDEDGDWIIQPHYVNARPFSEGLAAVQRVKNGKWGYIDPGGSVAIGLSWDGAWDFSEGVALVATIVAEDYYAGPLYAYAYIDSSGNVIWQGKAPVVTTTESTTTTAVPAVSTTTTAPAASAATTTTAPAVNTTTTTTVAP